MNYVKKWTLFLVLPAMLFFTSCSKDDDPFVRVTVNGTQLNTTPSDFVVGDGSDFNGDIDASFTGNGRNRYPCIQLEQQPEYGRLQCGYHGNLRR